MESFKTVNSVPTKVLSFGKNIEDDLSDVHHLILTISGNPGVIEYYREFMKSLYDDLQTKYPGRDIPVWGISNAGHQVDNVDSALFPSLADNPNLYTLEGQYEHKMSFIKAFIPDHIKIIGIGHSIGCKIWMETIKRMTCEDPRSSSRFLKCFMLFPVIERLRDTPYGKLSAPLVPMQTLIEYCLWPVTLLPTSFHRFILGLYFLTQGQVPTNVMEGSLQMFDFQVLKRFSILARCEFDQVCELDATTLKTHLDKFFFYFGTQDGWSPLSFVEDMKNTLPEMNYKICDKGFQHAFVIKSSSAMADVVSDLIKINI